MPCYVVLYGVLLCDAASGGGGRRRRSERLELAEVQCSCARHSLHRLRRRDPAAAHAHSAGAREIFPLLMPIIQARERSCRCSQGSCFTAAIIAVLGCLNLSLPLHSLIASLLMIFISPCLCQNLSCLPSPPLPPSPIPLLPFRPSWRTAGRTRGERGSQRSWRWGPWRRDASAACCPPCPRYHPLLIALPQVPPTAHCPAAGTISL